MGRRKLCYCSFCGCAEYETPDLIAGPDCHICAACVGLCVEIIEKNNAERARKEHHRDEPGREP